MSALQIIPCVKTWVAQRTTDSFYGRYEDGDTFTNEVAAQQVIDFLNRGIYDSDEGWGLVLTYKPHVEDPDWDTFYGYASFDEWLADVKEGNSTMGHFDGDQLRSPGYDATYAAREYRPEFKIKYLPVGDQMPHSLNEALALHAAQDGAR